MLPASFYAIAAIALFPILNAAGIVGCTTSPGARKLPLIITCVVRCLSTGRSRRMGVVTPECVTSAIAAVKRTTSRAACD